MKKKIFILSTIIAASSAAIIVSCNNSSAAKENATTDPTGFTYTASQAQRGAYLVTIMGCDDCHSPKTFGPNGPGLDLEHRLSGRPANAPLPPVNSEALKSWALLALDGTAAVGPWGVSFTANLTSDATGTGNWSFENFKTAMRKGKFKGIETNRELLPPMPWQQYSNLNDEDLHDIFAFLRTTKPVENRVPSAIPPTELDKKQ